jgi:hypothetical protein
MSKFHKLAGNKLDPLSATHNAVFEVQTGERYANPTAMAKHEAGESATQHAREIPTYKGLQ